jgi:hypothetical protein
MEEVSVDSIAVPTEAAELPKAEPAATAAAEAAQMRALQVRVCMQNHPHAPFPLYYCHLFPHIRAHVLCAFPRTRYVSLTTFYQSMITEVASEQAKKSLPW